MEISENQIVLLDFNFNQPEIIAFEGNFDEKKIENLYCMKTLTLRINY